MQIDQKKKKRIPNNLLRTLNITRYITRVIILHCILKIKCSL